MPKFVAALALIGAASAPSFAQSAPATSQAQTPQAQQYQIVKKRVCKTENADDIGSRIATRQTCKTVEQKVPVTANGEQNPATSPTPNAIR